MSKLIKGCGAIFYTKINNETYFLLGIDYKNRITDFGGKRESGETCKQCSIRESYEETSGVLGNINKIKKLFITSTKKIYFNTYLCYFVPIKYNKKIINIYLNKKKYFENHKIKISGFFELESMIWISHNDLLKIHLNNKLISSRTKYILKKYFLT